MHFAAGVAYNEVFAQLAMENVGHGIRVGDDRNRVIVERLVEKHPGVVGLGVDEAVARGKDPRVLGFIEIEATCIVTRPNSKRFEVEAFDVGYEGVRVLDDWSERLDE